MIDTYSDDILLEKELYDDFRRYPLSKRPRTHRGIARPYRKRKRRFIPSNTPVQILIPRKKARQFGRPVQHTFKKSPLKTIKKTANPPIPKVKKVVKTPQKVSTTKENIKALQKEISQKEVAQKKGVDDTKKKPFKRLIIVFAITTTAFIAYVVWQERKKMKL